LEVSEMGWEYSIKIKDKSFTEVLQCIHKALIEIGIQNINIDSKGIFIPSIEEGWSMLEITEYDNFIYCLSNEGERIIKQIERKLNDMGFECVFDDL
jgi:hypothetical protein